MAFCLRPQELRSCLCWTLLALAVTGCGGGGGPPPTPASNDLHERCEDVLARVRMPFVYQLPAASGMDQIRVETETGNFRNLTFGPWGAHASPHTGHPEGNGKADMMVPYTDALTQLTYIPDPEVACTEENFSDNGEVRCGMRRDALLGDRIGYIAPGAGFEVIGVFKEFEIVSATSPYAFDGTQWKVSIRATEGDCNLRFTFGHVESLGPAVIAALEARDIDWESAALYEELVDFEDPLPIAEGEIVAFPQIVGRSTELDEDFVVPDLGGGVIWTQVEFGVGVEFVHSELHDWSTFNYPVYAGLSEEEYPIWQGIFVDNVLDPANPRYGSWSSLRRQWLWAAEGELLLAPAYNVEEYPNIVASLASWWEGHPDCALDPTLCDTMVSFFPIHRDTALFPLVSEYYHPDTRYLVSTARGLDQTRVFSEVLGIHAYDEESEEYVVVDTIEESNHGALLLRVRPELMSEGTTLEDHILGYRALGYHYDPDARRLVLAWGDVHPEEAGALADIDGPPPTQDAPCTGNNEGGGSTTCHYRLTTAGWVNPGNVY